MSDYYPANQAEAFFGLFMALQLSDGQMTEEEQNGFLYLTRHSRSFGWRTGIDFQDCMERSGEVVKSTGSALELLDRCVLRIPDRLKLPAYLNCCDMIWRDPEIDRHIGEKILAIFQDKLGISETEATEVHNHIRTKYEL